MIVPLVIHITITLSPVTRISLITSKNFEKHKNTKSLPTNPDKVIYIIKQSEQHNNTKTLR